MIERIDKLGDNLEFTVNYDDGTEKRFQRACYLNSMRIKSRFILEQRG